MFQDTIEIKRKQAKINNKYVIGNLAAGRCYSVEMMSAASKILSFNRTWFYVRTSAPKFDIELKDVTKDTLLVILNEEQG